jgi:hypothetical protein
MTRGQAPPNKGRRYPAEVLTAAEVVAVLVGGQAGASQGP